MNSIYFGQCDKIRQTERGEEFWQQMMFYKQTISKKVFLTYVDPSIILDEHETIEQFIAADPESCFYASWVKDTYIFFLQTAGFEFIWKCIPSLEYLPYNARITRVGIETMREGEGADAKVWLIYNDVKIGRPSTMIELTILYKLGVAI